MLHAKYTRADEPWYPSLVGRITWPAGAEVLEVGCGTGALWANVAPLLPDLRLTLTDLCCFAGVRPEVGQSPAPV